MIAVDKAVRQPHLDKEVRQDRQGGVEGGRSRRGSGERQGGEAV